LGHVYLALANRHAAVSTGGRWVLRGEDDQTSWLRTLSREDMRRFGRDWLVDLSWLGLIPDEFVFESTLAAGADDAVRRVWPDAFDSGIFEHTPRVIGDTAEFYPYTLYLTARVAWMDAVCNVDHVIVGHDLLSRYGLYCHCCERMGLPIPKQTFVPRLTYDHGGQIDAVSKTDGRWKVATLRDRGYTPDRVMEVLRHACLRDRGGEWSLDNIQPHPILLEEWLA
jgi:glutamyl/glutaminyl-tRNA synthetase